MTATAQQGPTNPTQENITPEEQQIMQLYATLDVAAQAINRLESFCFSLTKMLIDAKLFTTGDLDMVMQILHKHNNLETFWTADINDEIQKIIQEAAEAAAAEEAPEDSEAEEVTEETSEEETEETSEEETSEEVAEEVAEESE